MPSGHFFEEPANLIKQELREPATYNVIIEAIASGSSRLNEIATKCKIESNKCAKYLSSLMSLGLVAREYPYGETASKRSIYKLEDNMFRFWYRFVFPNMSAITAGLGSNLFEGIMKDQLNAYMGLIFENICKQWFFVQAKKESSIDSPPFFIGSIGRWWGTNPATRKQEEIDIMAVHGDNALFAECKWTNADVDIDVFHDLKRKSAMFNYKTAYLYIFTKNFVTSILYEERINDRVMIYPLGEIIKTGG
jgi:AAA+ ATPase superfamily predicted ATPase